MNINFYVFVLFYFLFKIDKSFCQTKIKYKYFIISNGTVLDLKGDNNNYITIEYNNSNYTIDSIIDKVEYLDKKLSNITFTYENKVCNITTFMDKLYSRCSINENECKNIKFEKNAFVSPNKNIQKFNLKKDSNNENNFYKKINSIEDIERKKLEKICVSLQRKYKELESIEKICEDSKTFDLFYSLIQSENYCDKNEMLNNDMECICMQNKNCNNFDFTNNFINNEIIFTIMLLFLILLIIGVIRIKISESNKKSI